MDEPIEYAQVHPVHDVSTKNELNFFADGRPDFLTILESNG
jgi:hypothetical protein